MGPLSPSPIEAVGLRQFSIKDCNGYVATFCAEIASGESLTAAEPSPVQWCE